MDHETLGTVVRACAAGIAMTATVGFAVLVASFVQFVRRG